MTIWDARSGAQHERVSASGLVTEIVFSPDDRHLAAASGDSTITIWDVPTGREVQRMARSGMSTDQIALALIPRALELFRRNPTTWGMQIAGLDKFFSLDSMKYLSALPPGAGAAGTGAAGAGAAGAAAAAAAGVAGAGAAAG